MYTIPAFGPWPEQNAGPDEEKRLNSAQQSKTSPTIIDREHETGVFYGSGKLPYQTSLAACTCNDFVKRKKPCKHMPSLHCGIASGSICPGNDLLGLLPFDLAISQVHFPPEPGFFRIRQRCDFTPAIWKALQPPALHRQQAAHDPFRQARHVWLNDRVDVVQAPSS